MSANDIGMAIRFGIKETVGADLARLKPLIDTQMRAIETSMSTPVQEIERKFAAVVPTIERIGRAAANNRFISERQLTDLERAKMYVKDLADQLLRLNSSPEAIRALEKIQFGRQSIGLSQQLANPSLGAIASSPDYGRNVIDTTKLHGPIAPSRLSFNDIRDFERMGLATRSSFTREDEAVRQSRIAERMIRQDPKAYEARWVKLLEGQDTENRLKDAYERNRDPYSYSGRPEQRYLNPSGINQAELDWKDRLWKADARNRNPYSNQGPQETPRLDASLRWQEMNDQRNKYLQTSRELNQQFTVEESHYTKLTDKYGKFTEAQRESEKIRLRVREGLGHDVGTSQRALQDVMDPFSELNQRKSGFLGSHNFRFASQNAAFALEDYMISSQFGGPKAGFRAITNNLTAIAAAMPMLSPMASAGLIGGTAILGASAPLIYDRLMKKEVEQEEELKRHESFATVRRGQDQSVLDAFRRISTSGTDPSGKVGLLRSSQDAIYDSRQTSTALQNEYDLLIGNPTTNRKRILDIQAEQAKEQEIQSRQGGINRMASSGFDRDLVTNNLLRNLQRSFTATDVGLLNRQLEGEILSPAETFGNLRKQLFESHQLKRQREGDPINQRLMDEDYQKQLSQLEQDEARATTRHPFDLRNRDRAHERTMLGFEENPMTRLGKEFGIISRELMSNKGLTESQRQEQFRGIGAEFDRSMARLGRESERRLNQFEVDPVKRINKDFDLSRREIMTDQLLNDAQREQALVGLEKMRKGVIDQANEYPGLGSAIDVGSSADVALRQKYFDRSGSSGGVIESEKKLSEIVEAVREVKEAIKANKPKVASRRGR